MSDLSATGRARWLLALVAFCSPLGIGCGSSDQTQSAIERGQELFESQALSPSHLNDYTCATCHDAAAPSPPSKKSGAPLAGVTSRPLFWGGQEADLLRAVNACRDYFMLASSPLAADDRDARALYAYLDSIEPRDEMAQPFTVVSEIDPLPIGDAANGNALYVMACSTCHGAMHTGQGRLSERVPVLPEDTIAEHASYSPRIQRLIFTEKIRHGLFLGYSGNMPPLAAERLSNEEVSDILQALGVLGDLVP